MPLYFQQIQESGRDRRWRLVESCSGNAAGKARGARHRARTVAQLLLDCAAEEPPRKALRGGLTPGPTALKGRRDGMLAHRRLTRGADRAPGKSAFASAVR